MSCYAAVMGRHKQRRRTRTLSPLFPPNFKTWGLLDFLYIPSFLKVICLNSEGLISFFFCMLLLRQKLEKSCEWNFSDNKLAGWRSIKMTCLCRLTQEGFLVQKKSDLKWVLLAGRLAIGKAFAKTCYAEHVNDACFSSQTTEESIVRFRVNSFTAHWRARNQHRKVRGGLPLSAGLGLDGLWRPLPTEIVQV